MTKKFRAYPSASYAEYTAPGSDQYCIFVHGLAGSYDDGYWGALGRLLRVEPRADGTDVCFWGYNSNKTPFANITSALRPTDRLSNIDEVAENLFTFIKGKLAERNYQSVIIAGHSMGGGIAVIAAELQVKYSIKLNIKRICLLGCPTRRNSIARLAGMLSLANPHIRWLGSHAVDNVYQTGLDVIKSGGNKYSIDAVKYIRFSQDEVIPFSDHDSYRYDDNDSFERGHTPFTSIKNSTDPLFQCIARWMQND